MTMRADQSALSREYHMAHLSFARTEILEAAANREPILTRLHAYTRDVIHAERDGAFDENRSDMLGRSA